MKEYLYKELYELEEKHWWFVGKKKIVLSMLARYAGGKKNNILDIGCGSGLMLNSLEQYGRVSGLDCSEEAISFCNLIFKGDIKKGGLPYDIPYPKESFDVILVLDVLEHVEEDMDSIKTIRNYLVDDGICIITVPAFMFLWSSHDTVHEHKRRYIIKELETKVCSAGFKIEKISYYNSILFLPILIFRTFKKVFLKNSQNSDAKMPSKLINLIFKKLFSFERFLLRYFNLPIGVSILAVCKKEKRIY